jgi:transposase
MIFIGIDWSTQHDDICIIDNQGQVIKEFRIPVSATGFSKLLQVVEETESKPEEVYFGIETDKNILADFLLAAGYQVYSLNPLSVSRFKERYTTSGKKDDKFDAFNIASILVTDRDNFKPVCLSSNECRELQIHCQSVDNFVRQRSRLTNQLNAEIVRYFPAFSGFFSDLSSNVALNVLQKITKPSEIADLSEVDFEERVKDVKHFYKKRKADFFKYLKNEVIIFDNPLENAYALRVTLLAGQILSLNSTIVCLEKIIDEKFEKHPDSKIFKSIPGAGPRIAPALFVCFGDERSRFESYQQVQCYAGTAPVTAQSGKSFHQIKIRRMCNKNFRYVFYSLSFTCLKQSFWAKEHYHKQKQAGKNHSAALRSVANKWAKIIYSMWLNQTEYSENIFINKRAQNAA